MKRLLQYTAWNWGMGRGPVALLLALGAAAECLMLFVAAASVNQSALAYGDLVESAGILWVIAAAYLLLPICAQAVQEPGRTYGAYFLYAVYLAVVPLGVAAGACIVRYHLDGPGYGGSDPCSCTA